VAHLEYYLLNDAMKIIAWNTSINADGPRTLALKNLSFSTAGLVLNVEEETGVRRQITFKPVHLEQRWRLCAMNLQRSLLRCSMTECVHTS
jgi:hypothetical protein